MNSPFKQLREWQETQHFFKEQSVIKGWNGPNVAREILLGTSSGLFFKTGTGNIPGASPQHALPSKTAPQIVAITHWRGTTRCFIIPGLSCESISSENSIICYIPYYILDTKGGGKEKWKSRKKKKNTRIQQVLKPYNVMTGCNYLIVYGIILIRKKSQEIWRCKFLNAFMLRIKKKILSRFKNEHLCTYVNKCKKMQNTGKEHRLAYQSLSSVYAVQRLYFGVNVILVTSSSFKKKERKICEQT